MIESEFECQICLDLLVEPVTTVCVRYLKDKLNCPMCRKPVLQSKDSLSKNVLMENMLKSKYPDIYEERLKRNKLSYEGEESNDDNKRYNIPSIILEDAYVWPKIKRKIIVTNMSLESTLSTSSINDRLLVIIPNHAYENMISSLVEIVSINIRETEIDLEVLGLKRFKVNQFRNINTEIVEDNTNTNINTNTNTNPVYISSGEIIKDLEIDSTDILYSILEKLRQTEEIHSNILKDSTYTVTRRLETLYGKQPSMSSINNNNLSVSNLEHISFYYLNLIRNDEKKKFYLSNNIIQRVEWINEQFVKASEFHGNQSLAFEFYDMKVSGQPKDHLKFTLGLFAIIFLFCLAYKMKIIHF